MLDRKVAYIRNNDFPNENNEVKIKFIQTFYKGPFMQAGDYTLMLMAKDEDTVRIRLDFIQFTVKIHICIDTSMDRYI